MSAWRRELRCRIAARISEGVGNKGCPVGVRHGPALLADQLQGGAVEFQNALEWCELARAAHQLLPTTEQRQLPRHCANISMRLQHKAKAIR